jgi:hypothetical protein
MFRTLRGKAAPLAALALLAAFAGRGEAQYVVYSPAPVVSYYYAPPPPRVVTYYTPSVSYYAPRVSYYAPAVSYAAPAVTYSPGTVTTYRYGAILPRRRVTVTTYTPPTVSYYGPRYYYP